jgi:hypothetical protein
VDVVVAALGTPNVEEIDLWTKALDLVNAVVRTKTVNAESKVQANMMIDREYNSCGDDNHKVKKR